MSSFPSDLTDEGLSGNASGQYSNYASSGIQIAAGLERLEDLDFSNNSFWRTAEEFSADQSPSYSPNTQFEDPPSPFSDAGLQLANQHQDSLYPHQQGGLSPYWSPSDHSPAVSDAQLESVLATPEAIPSDEQIAAHISLNTSRENVLSHQHQRPEISVCVDTSLLFASHPDNDSGSSFTSSAHDSSPGLLSPHSPFFPTQSPLRRRHSNNRSSLGNRQEMHSFDNDSASTSNGLRHNRTRSVPSSRQHSPYEYAREIKHAVSDIRSMDVSMNPDLEDHDGTYYPSDDYSPVSTSGSASPSGKNQVATDRIKRASSDRRKYPASCICDECGDDFTTQFALTRHMKSHSGERNFPCTKSGCLQRFTTDSGRKRHEKSKTLHA